MNPGKNFKQNNTFILLALLTSLLLSNCTPFDSPKSQESSSSSDNKPTAVFALTEEDLPFGFVAVSPDDPAAGSLLDASQSIADAFIFGELTSVQQYRYTDNQNFAQISSGTIEPVIPLERAVFDRRLAKLENSPVSFLFSKLQNPVILTPVTSVTPVQLFLTGTVCQVTCGTNDLTLDLFIGRSKSTVFFVYYLHNPGINLPIDILDLSKILVFKNNKLK